MMTSSRPRGNVGSSFASRRGHASQLSISDPSHHVTEAIGTMYGDDDDSGAEDNRPLSFVTPKYGSGSENMMQKSQTPGEPSGDRLRLVRTISDQTTSTLSGAAPPGSGLKKTHTFPARMSSQRSISFDGEKSPLPPASPTPSLREGSQFPMTNIDNANDIAQELSNLQALRRMSMDVGINSDPDLLPFSGMSLVAIPAIAPTGDDDEADPSRLLWVPARVHPELEPTAFKDFLENRVQTMKRRSGDTMLTSSGSQRNDMSGLRRKKSMLSRQINTHSGDGYVDGAERLERNQSLNEYATPELSLNELVKDPTKAVRKLAQDAQEGAEGGDMPILPVAPGMGLRRSTRTTYRKGGGGSIRGERAPFAKRAAGRHTDSEDASPVPPVPPIDPGFVPQPLARVQSEPGTMTENFSRPTRSVRRQQNFSREIPPLGTSMLDGPARDEAISPVTASPVTPVSPPQLHALPVRSSSAAARNANVPPVPPIPLIIETPPVDVTPSPPRQFPERSSSQKAPQQIITEQLPVEAPPARSSKRPAASKPIPSPTSPTHANFNEQATPKEQPAHHEGSGVSEMANHPTALPGSGAMNTDNLTFIPTLSPSEDRRSERSEKKPKDKDDTESIMSTKSSSGWKWFKSDDKEKKKREKEREEQARKAKVKTVDKSHDTARLDVLQSSIDNTVAKGRESLLLERESIEYKLHEERKKESNRKASESKKEKDGFFGGLFGGSKKKGDKEPGHKKKEHRPLTPDPPPRQLRPDVDFPWTRFPIIEERAIYRMAHIKLANPRRPLHSQVLLSNFMYSYLAKVQAMHPQLQVPISPQQKRQEEERKRREAEQAAQQRQMEEQAAQQQAAQDGKSNFEYHRSGNHQYGDANQQDGSVQYVDDAQIYEYEHGVDQHSGEYGSSPTRQNGGHHHEQGYDDYSGQGQGGRQQPHQGNGSGQNYYYGRDNNHYDDDDDDENDMW
ncbi:hypothetical protein B0H63DRAFT_62373 [Podospora didyma]|uniref:Protein Zds1 C-terminal domain-containing protein n=1 Tax=Podospora didyma TaxID=330526 RepID=A0AAE0P7U9_9PEZI|nr:hypothetical protein B0H63DRAFT_62373 [Podospora didyma]